MQLAIGNLKLPIRNWQFNWQFETGNLQLLIQNLQFGFTYLQWTIFKLLLIIGNDKGGELHSASDKDPLWLDLQGSQQSNEFFQVLLE